MNLKDLFESPDESSGLMDLTRYPHCVKINVAALVDDFEVQEPEDTLMWMHWENGNHLVINISAGSKDRAVAAAKEIVKTLKEREQISSARLSYQLASRHFDPISRQQVDLSIGRWKPID